jgi:glyoxylate/hydroxypyruvate reductase
MKDHLDLKGLKAKGIRVGYTPGVLTNAGEFVDDSLVVADLEVADITVMLTLMTLRRVEEGLTIVKSDGVSSQ